MITTSKSSALKTLRFFTIMAILNKTEIFSEKEIVDELNEKNMDIRNVIEGAIEELMDAGLIYEIGASYKVRNRIKRWRRM